MRPSPTQIYRLDDIEVDPSKATLVKAGVEQRLRPKTQAVLYYLLENRGRIVSKDELMDNVWPDTAVTDDALTQCVSDIRKAFGDDSRHPRYLKTIPKQGFLFIGQVEQEAPRPEPAAPPPAAPIDRARPLIAIAAAILVLAAAGAWTWNSRQSVSSAGGRTSVAVMMFENRSGRADMEWMREGLADMLIGSLSRSTSLSILPREQVLDLVQRVKPADLKRVDLREALEISRRSRAQALIMGAYTVMGDAARVELRVFQTKDGQLVASEVLTVHRHADLLTNFDGLAIRTAGALNATWPPNRNGLATEARTASLEAYRLYTLGVERAGHFHHTEAVALFERALELDPEFHMAYARIGYTYAFSRGNSEVARPYLEKALARSAKMTPRDRLFVRAWHAFAANEYTVAIDTYRRIIQEYPGEISAYVALARILRGEKRLVEARETLHKALTIDPDWTDAHNLLSGIHIGLGDKDNGVASAIRATELAPEEPNMHDTLGMVYHRLGRYREALECFRHALALKPDFEIAIIHVGNTYVHLGRYREAIEQYRLFSRVTKLYEQKRRGREAIAWVLWKSGNIDAARREVADLPTALIRYALFPPGANAGLAEISGLNARGARPTGRYASAMLGYAALQSPAPATAIPHMQAAAKELPPYYMQSDFEECLAEAYLALGKTKEAIAEYRRIVDANPNLAAAHYGLGLALDKSGDREAARRSYRKFLEIWKDADRDLPSYKQAASRV
jgi:tetratricopeptide (TPR) repeat protein/DNA-binding winged helix-turn-helix (wHTH) protein